MRVRGGHRTSVENAVDGFSCPVAGVRPHAPVGVESLGRGLVSEAPLHGLHRLAVPDERARVLVPQRVHPGVRRVGQLGSLGGRPPDVPEALARQRAAVPREQQLTVADVVARDVVVQCGDDEAGEGTPYR